MIEVIANDILRKLNLTPSKDFEDSVGIEDHMAEMSLLLHLECVEVRMVGIWGQSGIGKTTIARALFSRLSHHFQGSAFIDKVFISKSMKVYGGATRVDYNVKLQLQRSFLAKFFDKNDIKIEHLGGAMENMLRHRKVLIFIDDLDDQDVLDALAGSSQWFGSGSRIIVVTKDKHLLRAHLIDHIYEVCLPSEDLALKMFCRSAFRKDYPPYEFMELASEVVLLAGNLPLGLDVLGSNLRNRDKEGWINMLPRLRKVLDGKIEKTLRVSYDGLKSEDESIFRHIACLFNGKGVNHIKMLLADSNLDVKFGLENLVDKSLIHVRRNIVEMHSLLQKMGIEIVRSQSSEPGEREFLMDPEEICNVLENNTGTKKVLGIALDIDEIDERHVHKNAFKGMPNLHFLEVQSRRVDYPELQCKLLLPKSFDHLPPKLKYLCWYRYPMRCLPSKFRPENLVYLIMCHSELEKLWEGVVSLTCLKVLRLWYSYKLKEIPDLSKATNLEGLFLGYCYSLLDLSSSIQNLKTLRKMDLSSCIKLKTIPTGIYLNSLQELDLSECSGLRSFPEILTQTTIEESPSNLCLELLDMTNLKSEKLCEGVQQPFTPLMTRLNLSHNPSLVELPSSFQNLHKLKELSISRCINLETLPTGINLQSLEDLSLDRCSRLRSFPDISRNIVELDLRKTAIDEVPWWIENFSRLTKLRMSHCDDLRRVSLNILKLKHLEMADFSNCEELTKAWWDNSPSVVAMATDNIHSRLPDEASSSLPDDYISMVRVFNFTRCLNFDPTALLEQQTAFMKVIVPGKKVPSYFTHRTTGNSLTNIPLPHFSPSQPFLRFKACVLFEVKYDILSTKLSIEIQVCFRFRDISGNRFDYDDLPREFSMWGHGGHLFIFDCCFPLNKDITPLADQLDYDNVDIQFRLIRIDHNRIQLKGCGIQLLDNGQPWGNRPGNPHVSGGNSSNKAYLGDHEDEHSQECGGSAVESNPDTLSHVWETDEDNIFNDGCHETEQSEIFVSSDEETVRNSKQKRVIIKHELNRILLFQMRKVLTWKSLNLRRVKQRQGVR